MSNQKKYKVKFNNTWSIAGSFARIHQKMYKMWQNEGSTFAHVAWAWMKSEEKDSCHITFDPDTRSIGICEYDLHPLPPTWDDLNPPTWEEEVKAMNKQDGEDEAANDYNYARQNGDFETF